MSSATDAGSSSGVSDTVISVAIPCYNYGRYLESCVRSVVEQQGVSTRVLIVDDCSSDDSQERAAELVRVFDNVEYTRHARNQGHIATFNDGVDWANGLGFALLSADDLLAPGSLGTAASVLTAHPSVGLLYGDVLRFDEVAPSPVVAPPVVSIVPGGTWVRRRCSTGENNTFSPEIVVRTDVQRQIGPYHHGLKHTSDLHMWLRAATVSDVARVAGPTHAFYRVHGDNMSAGFGEAALDLEQRREAFRLFFADADFRRPESERLERLAMRALARDAVERSSRRMDHDAEFDPSDLVDFALDTDPGLTRSPAWLGHTLRRRLGPGRWPWFPPFVLGRLARRARFLRRHPRLRRDPD
ncbi:glycosyltransferase [Ilumatobacter coccineus]|uniref:Putative glycosyltransferase n=1 Tax=Ilumatobacter coccineus (strain NBRC 103263 / KCTC 29153 / YM16-304) TaxID=1313172 RepID=A0A6C7E5C0_ILUCY|nr:glycosyltransferase [Ilumatobacter coccineus]BAN01750.1 putative glycosyltransferase [Ilumatobacter coccineus YM16-304]